MERGIDSLNLCGPYDGLTVQIPPNLESIQLFGATILFKCFLGPLAYMDKNTNIPWLVQREN